jgi:hypothetical protein
LTNVDTLLMHLPIVYGLLTIRNRSKKNESEDIQAGVQPTERNACSRRENCDGNDNRLPIPETVTADNGLEVKSN